MDLNTILFGGLALISLVVFFYLGKFKASKAQTERDNRPKWNKGIREYKGCLIQSLIFLGAIIILNYLMLYTWIKHYQLVIFYHLSHFYTNLLFYSR